MRRPTMLLLAGLVALALTAGACGGGGGDDSGNDPTAEATAVPFDPRLLTAAVLNPGDFPPGFEGGVQRPPEGASFASVFTGFGLRYQSTVVYFPNKADAEIEFQRNREVIPSLSPGAREENYAIPGLSLAYLDVVYAPPGLAAWGLHENFMVFLQIAPTDAANPNPVAVDRQEFARVSRLVGERVAKLAANPELVTPLAVPETTPVAFPTTAPTPGAVATP